MTLHLCLWELNWLTVSSQLQFWAPIVQQLAVAAASIVGGFWIILKLWKEREWYTALDIEINSFPTAIGENFLVLLEVALTNKGRVKLQAKPADSTTGSYHDSVENLKYSCSLQLKMLKASDCATAAWVNWFQKDAFQSPIFHEIDLLHEYSNPDRNDRTEFWMEPGEAYKLGTILTLPPGKYVMKITFVGKARKDFWSRTSLLLLPPGNGPA